MATELGKESTEEQFRRFIAECRSPVIRTMAEFAEQEVVIPDGPFEGLKFRMDRQPYTRLLYEAIDSGNWNRFVITGPTQSGKTLSACIVPIMYHLFEMRETVIFAMPNMDMAGDKWNEDLRPAIEASRYRDLLPTTGQGSRSASKLDAVRFKNGATLKFMSGGGSDKKRAAFTSRVVVITETDGMDEQGGNSREADKITQIEARTRAYGERKRIYMECTVSIEEGRTWREYKAGTQSKILLPCPHCKGWVSPEREDLTGWQSCTDTQSARKSGVISCPNCHKHWTEPQRVKANRNAIILHRGQEIQDSGKVKGEAAPTGTLGFRWSAVNNLFLSAGDVAADEWRASQSDDEDNADREMRQFVWAIPYVPQKVDMSDLNIRELIRRQGLLQRGVVPEDRVALTLGVDVGDHRVHWTAIAWTRDGGGRVIDYGYVDVKKGMVAHAAITDSLRDIRDMAEQGWPTPQGEIVSMTAAFVDAHYRTPMVKGFCSESGAKWMPSIGFGTGEYHDGGKSARYGQPKTTGSVVRHIGEMYHSVYIRGERELTWQFDADYWKTQVHERLSCPEASPGALLLYAVENQIDHQTFCRHLTSERKTEEFIKEKGNVIKWEKQRSANHWLDSTVMATIAGHLNGVRITHFEEKKERKRIKLSGLR